MFVGTGVNDHAIVVLPFLYRNKKTFFFVTLRHLSFAYQVSREDVFVVDVVRIVDEADQLEVVAHIFESLKSCIYKAFIRQVREQTIEEHDAM
jgi:hypothetical protein